MADKAVYFFFCFYNFTSPRFDCPNSGKNLLHLVIAQIGFVCVLKQMYNILSSAGCHQTNQLAEAAKEGANYQ